MAFRCGSNQIAVCTMALLIPLYLVHRRARRHGAFDAYQSPLRLLGTRQLARLSFWYLDVVGMVLLIAVLALILTPFTIARGESSQWKTAKILAPLVVGICCIPAWITWERTCKHPMVPFKVESPFSRVKREDLLTYAAVTERPSCLGRAGNCRHAEYWYALSRPICVYVTDIEAAWALQGNYLYTVLVVSFGESITSATRITSLYRLVICLMIPREFPLTFVYSFASVITGCLLGFVILKVRRLKMFIVAGTMLFTVAFGILINFRGGSGDSSHSGVIGGQVLLGIGKSLVCLTLGIMMLRSYSRRFVPISLPGQHPGCHQART